MQDRLIKILTVKIEAINKNIDNLNYLNGELLKNNNDLDYINDKISIFKTKDIIAEISSLSKVHEELKILEGQVKKELSETSNIRGGAIEGYTPRFKRT